MVEYLELALSNARVNGSSRKLGGLHMKILFKAVLAASVVAASAAPVMAQNSDSASVTTNGSTTIVAPITITQRSPLIFGSVVRPTSGITTVTLSPTTCSVALTGAGNGAVLSSSSPACAAYTAGGESGLAFNITTDPTLTMSRSGGGSLTVNLSSSATTGTIGATDEDFSVGGSFDVDNTTLAGAYSGSFSVTVTYQ